MEDTAMSWKVCEKHNVINCWPCFQDSQQKKYWNRVQFIEGKSLEVEVKEDGLYPVKK